jgi:hypothetical protein
MLLFSTAGAAVLYYMVESGFRDMGRRIARSWSRKADNSKEADPPLRAASNQGLIALHQGKFSCPIVADAALPHRHERKVK